MAGILELNVHSIPPSNLTSSQNKALLKLWSYKNLTIKAAEKGGNVVVPDIPIYKNICLDLLNNQTWYRPISTGQVETFKQEFYALIDEAYHDSVINKTIWEYIRAEHERKATFYCLPKIHKTGVKLTGRPIVSGNGNSTENAIRLVDATLRPHVATLPPFIKDMMSFL